MLRFIIYALYVEQQLITHFNTSHVTVYQDAIAQLEDDLKISIHLMLRFIVVLPTEYN